MDTARFKEILKCFLVSDTDFDMDKGELALEVNGEFVSATLETRTGSLYIREGDVRTTAEDWLIRRIAGIPLLAERIISAIPENTTFVEAPGTFLDDILHSPTDEIANVSNSPQAVFDFLDRRPGGTCSILYLTSDAGEGKTTLINQVARAQALRYKRKESDWLLVPIGLGGRPFLRFDDVVVASMVNQLRFQRLYFEAFVELVRMGVLVPALDGFEEIFVENAVGDAISSLGSLIRQLSGEGSLLIAARKAYFEFRRLETQAKLLDGLPNTDVSFGRVGLCRWSRTEFLEYAEKSDIPYSDVIYDQIAEILGSTDHPLLSRPVLVRRLLELYRLKGVHLLTGLRPEESNYFLWLIDKLLEREANEKWINKHGDPPTPLLSVREHHELLGYVAEEMWVSKTGVLNKDMFDSLADIFCEAKRLSPLISRQVRERLKQHALIVSSGFGREFSFDHEEFRDFFLGEQLATYLRAENEIELRRLLRADLLASLTISTALNALQNVTDSGSIVAMLHVVGESESSASFVRENTGALIARLITWIHSQPITVTGLVFPPDALEGQEFRSIRFVDCFFRATSLEKTTIDQCTFENCEFEYLGLDLSTKVTESDLTSTRIHALWTYDEEGGEEIYDPDRMVGRLGMKGFSVNSQLQFSDDSYEEKDPDFRIAEKALQAFQRSTYIFEKTFKLRLSINASRFFNDLLPRMMRTGLIEKLQLAALEKYRLGVPFSEVAKALSSANGSFEALMLYFE